MLPACKAGQHVMSGPRRVRTRRPADQSRPSRRPPAQILLDGLIEWEGWSERVHDVRFRIHLPTGSGCLLGAVGSLAVRSEITGRVPGWEPGGFRPSIRTPEPGRP